VLDDVEAYHQRHKELLSPLHYRWLLTLETQERRNGLGLRPMAQSDVAMNLESALSKLADFVRENRSTILLYLPKHFI
jgi:hypothetical protein